MKKPIQRVTETEEFQRVNIDKKDRKILTLLMHNSRRQLSLIAKEIGMSRDAVAYRIKRLIEKKVIAGFIPLINFKKFGYDCYHVFLLIDEKNAERTEALLDYLKINPNIVSIIEYSDRWDLEFILLAKDFDEFYERLSDISYKFSDIISEKDKLAVIKDFHFSFVPKHFWDKEIRLKSLFEEKINNKKKGLMIDKKDIEIIKQLCVDARQSSYEIGKKLKMSPDTVAYRIKKLEENKIIKEFSTVLNLSVLDYNWYTFSIQMKFLGKDEETRFSRFVKSHPYIVEAVETLGTWDLLLYIVSNNPKNFHKTIKEIKNEFAHTITNYQTWLAYKEHFFTPFPSVLETSLKI